VPVLAAYQRLVQEGKLNGDDRQVAAARRLSVLADAVKRHQHAGLLGLGRGRFAPGVYLWGDVGRGKSMLMTLFAQEAGLQALRKQHFHVFIADIQERLRSQRALKAKDPLARVIADFAREVRILCLDELEIRDIATASIMARLFEALFREKVAVVTTSNRPPDDLYLDGQNREYILPFIALLKEQMEVIELDAARDYRLRRLTEAQLWLDPLTPNNRARFDDLWRILTADAPLAPLKIAIASRSWMLNRAASDAVKLTFAEACEAERGVNDYLALAEQCSTVFLEDIPALGPDQRNAARRFVLLIDALYEARVKLVALAQTPPDALYQQGDGAFEFGRTVSRLSEMRSSEYLGARR
jgi:cell division protein ZapE